MPDTTCGVTVGSSYLGFSEATTFHPQIGPVVMVVYAQVCYRLIQYAHSTQSHLNLQSAEQHPASHDLDLHLVESVCHHQLGQSACRPSMAIIDWELMRFRIFYR